MFSTTMLSLKMNIEYLHIPCVSKGTPHLGHFRNVSKHVSYNQTYLSLTLSIQLKCWSILHLGADIEMLCRVCWTKKNWYTILFTRRYRTTMIAISILATVSNFEHSWQSNLANFWGFSCLCHTWHPSLIKEVARMPHICDNRPRDQ